MFKYVFSSLLLLFGFWQGTEGLGVWRVARVNSDIRTTR